ncbi:MAG: hypothetical protein JZU47_22600 [Prolixibacteraceae bacterium]|nr:hypothetical protein [Prolixibacteraceae bacterium]
MTNKNAVKRFEDTRGAHINKLIWIASVLENTSELIEMVEYFDDRVWNKLFPEIFKSQYFEEYKEDIFEAVCDFELFGFLAEIHIPICDNFKFDSNGEISGYQHHPGHCRIEYVYAETPAALISKIEKESNRLFKEFARIHKTKSK